MDSIKIDLSLLEKKGLNINEYLTLIKLRFMNEKEIPFRYDTSLITILEGKGFLKKDLENKFSLTKEGENLFQNNYKLFEEFYNIFPNVVPNGFGGFRPVSDQNPEGILGKQTFAIWEEMTEKNETLQNHIIECLKDELETRRKTNTLQYLHNIKTWLKNSTWEKQNRHLEKYKYISQIIEKDEKINELSHRIDDLQKKLIKLYEDQKNSKL